MLLLRIRLATDDDAPAIAVIHEASIRGLASTHYEPELIAAWADGKQPERYRRAILEGEHMFVAQRRDGVIVGFASYRDDELRAVYVDPAHARHRIGTRLLRTVEIHARAHGQTRLRLSASLNAVTFYAIHGYAEIQRSSHPLRAGLELECVVMAKVIA